MGRKRAKSRAYVVPVSTTSAFKPKQYDVAIKPSPPFDAVKYKTLMLAFPKRRTTFRPITAHLFRVSNNTTHIITAIPNRNNRSVRTMANVSAIRNIVK